MVGEQGAICCVIWTDCLIGSGWCAAHIMMTIGPWGGDGGLEQSEGIENECPPNLRGQNALHTRLVPVREKKPLT